MNPRPEMHTSPTTHTKNKTAQIGKMLMGAISGLPVSFLYEVRNKRTRFQKIPKAPATCNWAKSGAPCQCQHTAAHALRRTGGASRRVLV